jgi:hypothetical protein
METSGVGGYHHAVSRLMTPARLVTLFRRERARFARAYPRVEHAGLGIDDARCSPGGHCRRRDVAWADRRTRTVWLLARALALPPANLVALVRHELGHLADPTPGRPGAEARADRIAWEVTGVRIRYDGGALQTTGRGGPRPRWLHR